jgi:hypothetical protein
LKRSSATTRLRRLVERGRFHGGWREAIARTGLQNGRAGAAADHLPIGCS